MIPNPAVSNKKGDLILVTNEHTATPSRKVAMVTGIFFIITFIASIPGLMLYGPLLHNPEYITSSGADTSIFWGALLEMITALTGIGTAVTLYSTLKKYNHGFAIGYVATRTLEASIIVMGFLSLLAVVTLRQTYAGVAGTDTASLLMIGRMLVAIHDWSFLFGPGTMPAVNGVVLGYLMYKSGLVPRKLTYLGMFGGPILLTATVAALFGLFPQISVIGAIMTIPIFFWELLLGLWLIFKGFNSEAVVS